MTDFDGAWKEAIESFFEPFMAFFFPEAHREIDWSRDVEMLDKELHEMATASEQGPRVVDKLVKVWRKDGQDEWVLVHIEVQSQPEGDFARRMYVYNYRLFDRYNKRVASFAILGDDRSGWRPNSLGMNCGERRLPFNLRRQSCSTTRATMPRWKAIQTRLPWWCSHI